jgi:SLOG cluster3 family
MRSIFLSASTPDPKRDPKYHSTADLSAIRDAVRALVTVSVPTYRIVWGGHPSITPLVRVIVEGMGMTSGDLFGVFQSNFFKDVLPKDNAAFEMVVMTRAARLKPQDKAKAAAAVGPNTSDEAKQRATRQAVKKASLDIMRRQMIGSAPFAAGFFIGGMEGVEEEYDMFRQMHQAAPAYPVASTGGAALLIYNRDQSGLESGLATDLAFPSLFRRLLGLAAPTSP